MVAFVALVGCVNETLRLRLEWWRRFGSGRLSASRWGYGRSGYSLWEEQPVIYQAGKNEIKMLPPVNYTEIFYLFIFIAKLQCFSGAFVCFYLPFQGRQSHNPFTHTILCVCWKKEEAVRKVQRCCYWRLGGCAGARRKAALNSAPAYCMGKWLYLPGVLADAIPCLGSLRCCVPRSPHGPGLGAPRQARLCPAQMVGTKKRGTEGAGPAMGGCCVFVFEPCWTFLNIN